jgi:hypothetical protein
MPWFPTATSYQQASDHHHAWSGTSTNILKFEMNNPVQIRNIREESWKDEEGVLGEGGGDSGLSVPEKEDRAVPAPASTWDG